MSDTIQAESEPETRKAGVEDNDKEQIKTRDETKCGIAFWHQHTVALSGQDKHSYADEDTPRHFLEL